MRMSAVNAKEKGQLNGRYGVTTIMSNLSLYKACDPRRVSGMRETAVGDKYVCENHDGKLAILSAESSPATSFQ